MLREDNLLKNSAACSIVMSSTYLSINILHVNRKLAILDLEIVTTCDWIESFNKGLYNYVKGVFLRHNSFTTSASSQYTRQ